MNGVFIPLHACLDRQATLHPDRSLFSYVSSAGERSSELTGAQLVARAKALAQSILRAGGRGQRVLLLFTPGLDFIVAFYACLYAGAVAVPAYPPDPSNLQRTLPRLRAVTVNASVALIVTNRQILAFKDYLSRLVPELAVPAWIDVEADENATGDAEIHLPSAQDLALIQYTSGSTAAPKGVMVSHGNLMANMRMFQRAGQLTPASKIFSWLPTYHDLGLMCGVVLPVGVGCEAQLASPLDFLKRPALWLEAIARERTTHTCAPNFALDLVVRKAASAGASWNLDSLQLCLIGAEPVRHASLERFASAFASHGLRREALVPGYGLAEAVVGVCSTPYAQGWRTLDADADALARHRVEPTAAPSQRSLTLVSSGTPCEGVSIAIVDPSTRRACAPGEIGEIWIDGPHVAQGYWDAADTGDNPFRASMDGETGGSWLRSGDLGFIAHDHLYVTGRIKDLIIARGANHYPQDIEHTVEQAHASLRPGATIAFSAEQHGEEALVVVAEIAPPAAEGVAQEIARAIHARVLQAHGLAVATVALIKPRSIDKTSSGKLARRACKARFLAGQLDAFFQDASALTPTIAASLAGREEGTTAADTAPASLDETLHRTISELTSTPAANLGMGTRLADLGLDSLLAAELASVLERRLGVELSVVEVMRSATIAELRDTLGRATRAEAAKDGPVRAVRLRHAQALEAPAVRAPLFLVGGLFGSVAYLLTLAGALGKDQPCIAFQAAGIDGDEPPLGSVEEMARRYIDEMKAIQPHGPYHLAGHSFGGMVAFEMARQLTERGDAVAALLLLDTALLDGHEAAGTPADVMALHELAYVARRIAGHHAPPSSAADGAADVETQRRALLRELHGDRGGAFADSPLGAIADVHAASFDAMAAYQPRPYAGPVVLLRASEGFPAASIHPARRVRHRFGERALGWERHCPRLLVVDVPGDHYSMVLSPHGHALAAAMRAHLQPAHYALALRQLAGPATGRPATRPLMALHHGLAFNPEHADFFEDPYPVLRQLRDREPVYRMEDAVTGATAWWLTRHADVAAGLRDKRLLADGRELLSEKLAENSGKVVTAVFQLIRQRPGAAADFVNRAMLFIDGAAHRRLRQLMNPLFDASALQRWQASIDQRIAYLVERMRGIDEPDLMRDFALRLPRHVMFGMLGISARDGEALDALAGDAFRITEATAVAENPARSEKAIAAIMEHLRSHIAARRGAPARDDLLGHLLQAQVDGDRLSDEDLAANGTLLLLAGTEVLAFAIGNAVLALLRHPDQFERLREQPELVASATEELLRYDGPVRVNVRVAAEDLSIGGRQIRRGDPVVLDLGAANRDPAMFPLPDRLDLARPVRQLTSFGQGVHYCLGATLARMQMQSALLALARHRFDAVPGRLRWGRSTIARRLDQFGIRFS